tara:strand:- start:67 stop:324 length:258 start_codon:yes stop_codon:yes gene_type:complete
MRLVLGIASSAVEPTMYSLVSDYVPQKRISTVNSLMAAGSYLGAGLSSVCIYIIAARGWRASFKYTGFFGLILAFLSFLFVKEPK